MDTFGRGVRGIAAGNSKTMARLVAIAGIGALAPAAMRALVPAIMVVAEIALAVGQAGLTWLRTGGF